MGIQAGNILFFKSDTMEDTDDGGGRISAYPIATGDVNSIFNDIGSGDRINGATRMRKLFPKVNSQSNGVYIKSRTVLTHVPADENVDVLLFSTGSHYDRARDAKLRVEAYRAKGARFSGKLYATQYKSSKLVTIYQSVDAVPPEIGGVYYLSMDDDAVNQYIRITDVETEIVSFTIGTPSRTFDKKVVTLKLADELNHDFIGGEVSDKDDVQPRASMLTTIVADSAKYASARAIVEAGSAGDMHISVASVYAQLVPASLREKGYVSVDPIQLRTGLVKASAANVLLSQSVVWGGARVVKVGSPIYPDTLAVDFGGVTYVDSAGNLVDGTGSVIATINYKSGEITFNNTIGEVSGIAGLSFIPAGVTNGTAKTSLITVSDANRGNVYTITLRPLPAKGSVRLDYFSLGNWHSLYDNGNGELLSTNSHVGSGTIDYVTGSIIITLGSLPDVDSAIIFTWSTDTTSTSWTTETYPKAVITHQIDKGAIGTSGEIHWGGNTATIDAEGVITGDATGTLDTSGRLSFTPNQMPPKLTRFTITTNHAVTEVSTTNSINWDAPSNTMSGTVANSADIIANTVTITYFSRFANIWGHWVGLTTWWHHSLKSCRDDGAGNLVDASGAVVGAIDYTTGDWSITPNYASQSYRIPSDNGDYVTHNITASDNVTIISPNPPTHTAGTKSIGLAGYQQDLVTSGAKTLAQQLEVVFSVAGATVSKTTVVDLDTLTLDINDVVTGDVVKGSVRFELLGRSYIMPVSTNNTIISNLIGDQYDLSGSMSSANNVITITDWDASAETTPVFSAIATELKVEPITQLVMRVPNAPVKVSAFEIRVTDIDGVDHIAQADAVGNVIGGDIVGTIQYLTGVGEFRFGQLVPDNASAQSEWWYDANNVVDGQIFKPTLIDPSSIVYDTTTQKFLPIDSDIIGINVVRLPEDGRVPVFNTGGTVLVMNTQVVTQVFGSNTQTDLGRLDIDNLVVEDDNGALVVGSVYTFDLATGLIDWGDLAGVAQPITVRHRVEDELILENVDITGKLTLSTPLNHEYPIEGTVVSSELQHGDLHAHVSTVFVQKAWENKWSSERIGDDIFAKYNDAHYPIVVTNESCVTDRWLIKFVSPTSVDVISEQMGVLLENHDIATPIQPTNPGTGFPYMIINPLGFGAGWSSGDCLRVDTVGGYSDVWLIMSVNRGESTDTSPDGRKICIELRGDKNSE